MDLTPGIKELHIISLNITWAEILAANFVMIAICVAIAFGIYDTWFNKKG